MKTTQRISQMHLVKTDHGYQILQLMFNKLVFISQTSTIYYLQNTKYKVNEVELEGNYKIL